MKKITVSLLLAAALLTGGCAAKSPVCASLEPGESLLCDLLGNPERAALVLEISTIEAVRNGLIDPADFLAFTARVRSVVMVEGATPDQVRRHIASAVPDEYRAYFHLSRRHMRAFEGVTAPLTERDRAMLLWELDELDFLAGL